MIWLILQMLGVIFLAGLLGLACGIWFHHARAKRQEAELRADLSAARHAFAQSEQKRLSKIERIGPFLSHGGQADPTAPSGHQENLAREQLEEVQRLLDRAMADNLLLQNENNDMRGEIAAQNENALALQDQISGYLSDATHLDQELASQKHEIARLREQLRLADVKIEISSTISEEEHEKLAWKLRYLGSRIAFLEEKLGPLDAETPKPKHQKGSGDTDPEHDRNDEINPQTQLDKMTDHRSANNADKRQNESAATKSSIAAPSTAEDLNPLPVIDEEGLGEIPIEEVTRAIGDNLDDALHFDDLKQIKGIGPKLELKLNRLGIKNFTQIGNWTKADVENIDERLKFKGRIQRDDWIGQAKKLAEQQQS